MESKKRKIFKYLPILLFVLVVAVLAFLTGRRYSTTQPAITTSPSPSTSASPTPKGSVKPTPTPVSGTGTILATFTTNSGGPGNNKIPYANIKITVYTANNKLAASGQTDQNGKYTTSISTGSYYMLAPADSYFKRIDFTIQPNQITYISKNIASPKN